MMLSRLIVMLTGKKNQTYHFTPSSGTAACIVIVAILFTGFDVLGQLADESMYARESVYLQSGSFVKNNVRYRTGFLGSRLKKEMEISPEAYSEFRKFQTKAAIGSALRLTGFILLSMAAGAETDNEQSSLLLGGLVVSFISLPIRGSAHNTLHKAVWIRNRDVMQ